MSHGMLMAMRKMIAIASASVLAIGLAGCDSGDDDAASTESSAASAEAAESAGASASADIATADPSTRPALPIAWCDDVPDLADSLDYAGPQYSELANGYLTGQALAYALEFPFYVGVWPRTNHETWLIVGVNGGMQELQADLDLKFPGARVLAMNINWDPYSLSVLSDSVAAAVQPIAPEALVDWSSATGLVTIELAEDDVSDELAAALFQFSESNVCAELTV